MSPFSGTGIFVNFFTSRHNILLSLFMVGLRLDFLSDCRAEFLATNVPLPYPMMISLSVPRCSSKLSGVLS